MLMDLKQQMLLLAYRDDILNNKDRNDFQQTDINYGDTMRRKDIMESMALKYNSECELTENRMYRRDVISVSTWKNADTNLVLDIAAKAYTKQIILYTQTRDPQKAGLAYNTRKTYFGEEAKFEAKFTGQEVIIILHSPVRAHFYIVSRYPLMEGMTPDGRGIQGDPIPPHISISEMNIGEGNDQKHHPKMPFLQKCIGCNKFILGT